MERENTTRTNTNVIRTTLNLVSMSSNIRVSPVIFLVIESLGELGYEKTL